MDNKIAPGDEAIIKHVTSSLTPDWAASYRIVRVTRITKARVFVKGPAELAREVEFRLDNLKEYGKKRWDADELIVDPAKIAEIRAEVARRAARRALEVRAAIAMKELCNLFDGYAVSRRTEEEILLLEELRDRLRPPAKTDV